MRSSFDCLQIVLGMAEEKNEKEKKRILIIVNHTIQLC
jgi:hypothetical protein